jgi:dTDP-glucose 4,6-dehydratase
MYNTDSVIVRIFNTYGPGEWFHPFRSVNCVFTYNLLNSIPITVFKGHTRTSTYVYDCARTISNIADNFKSGETYNIASQENHTIEYLAELILKHTKASPSLVKFEDKHEVLTTKDKFVDASKAVKDLDHKCTHSLEEGVIETIDWMRRYYGV